MEPARDEPQQRDAAPQRGPEGDSQGAPRGETQSGSEGVPEGRPQAEEAPDKDLGEERESISSTSFMSS